MRSRGAVSSLSREVVQSVDWTIASEDERKCSKTRPAMKIGNTKMKKNEKDEIIIKDETKAHLFVYVLIFFFIAIAMIVIGLAKKGPSYNTLIELIVITVIGYITFLFYKNHRSFIVIDTLGIACFETKGLSSKILTKWNFQFDDCIQISLIKGEVPIGSGSNRQDSFKIIAWHKSKKYTSKTCVARLDSFKITSIQDFAKRHDVNIVIGG
jgi:hypothetical protein